MTVSKGRTIAANTLLAVGGVLAALGLLAAHLNRQVFDGPTFADHVDEIRRDEDVARLVGTEISAQVIASSPDLAALRPLVDDLAIRVAGTDLLSGPTRQAASAAHSALVDGDGDTVVLRISDAGAVVAAVLAAVAPDRAPAPTDVSVTLAELGDQGFSTGLLAVARAIDLLAWALPAAALACFGAAILLSRRRWRTAGASGRVVVASASVVGVLIVVGGLLVRRLDNDVIGTAVARAAWTSMIQPLWWSVAIAAAIGLAVAFACDSSAPAAVADRAAKARVMLTRRPQTTLGVVVRVGAAAAVGVAAIADPSGLVEPLIALAGVGLVLYAITGLAGLVESSRAAGDVVEASASDSTPRRRSRTVAYGVLGLAAALLIGAIVFQARPGGEVAAVDSDGEPTCNGHVELCDRPFDAVAYATSHNSMSVLNEPGWFLAEQTDPIPAQLDQGVRALLVDVWSGRSGQSVVRTASSSYQEALEVAERELGPEVVDAALRIATSIAGDAEGPERRYLCHGLCETGSTPFVEMLEQLRGWLVTNPDDVVTLFIEDHVTADLIAEDVEAAGLVPLIATPPAIGEPWPTLGEMIEANRRLVVMLENGEGGDDAQWLVNGFAYTQDTPYTFPTAEDFSCAPNRGPEEAPLLLLNHWLANFTTLVSDAERVNRSDVLLARAEQCEDERGQIPNFVAVNYADRGDLYDVVDALNGVGG